MHLNAHFNSIDIFSKNQIPRCIANLEKYLSQFLSKCHIKHLSEIIDNYANLRLPMAHGEVVLESEYVYKQTDRKTERQKDRKTDS